MRELSDRYRMVQHGICLLAYVSKHRNEWQTYQGFEEKCGIPRRTLAYLILDAHENGESSILASIAYANGYDYCLMKGAGKIIDVEYRGPFPLRTLSDYHYFLR